MLISTIASGYPRWQKALFWLSWAALFIPGFMLAFGTARLANLLWMGYRDDADILIFGVLVLGLIAISLIALLTYWAYTTASREYWQVMLWQLVGLLIVPLLTLFTALWVYYQWVMLAG